MFLNPLQRSRAKFLYTVIRQHMSEARQGGYEFCGASVYRVFARRAEGQAAGHPFFGSFLWSEQRNERKVVFFGLEYLLD